ncbi:winged helix DNA-binding domain-containing protein [Specibacter cremeus]|uniref:winged helix DNA-binding domain-containing protein n=1 Tax=Specibacter cremeus TaxID=1629051 RepID=UPI000F770076|nr:winged helix DNA-binding domain-containing protein [Specibacter cremeus]
MSLLAPGTIARLRLAAQWLLPGLRPAGTDVADTVRWMTALQGQDFPGAMWSIGMRTPGATRADVVSAFNVGAIVRSWPMRGTLHVTAAEDLGWIMATCAGRITGSFTARHRQLGITAPDVEQAGEAARALLGSGTGRATREDLFAAFNAAGQATANQRGIHLLLLLSLAGTLVQGPVNAAGGNGNGQFFVLAETWIPHPRRLERDEAVAELALRYFRSHGPATARDFQWWTKLTLAEIRAALAQVGAQLAAVDVRGTTYWMAPETAALLDGGPVPGGRSLLLPPGFDELLLGYTDRTASLDPEHAEHTVPGNNGMFRATVVAGGRVVGTWRKAPKGSAGVVLPEPFDELGPGRQRALAKASAAYAGFLRG